MRIFYSRFFLFTLFLFAGNLFAAWQTASPLNRVHQIDGPVEGGDAKQKILKIVMSSKAPAGSSSINNLSFSLTGSSEISTLKIVYPSTPNDSNFANATNTFGTPVNFPGTSVSVSGTFSATTATALYFFWLIIDLNAAISNAVYVDASLTGFSGGSTPVWENGTLPINPTGFRFTSRNYKIGTGEQYPTILETARGISRFDYDGAADIFMEMNSNYANPAEGQIIFNNHSGPATITIRPLAAQSGKITQGDPGSGVYLVGFSAVNKIILDGRPGGSGTSREWTIRNTRSASIIAGAIAFQNAGSVNTLSFLNIEAANTVEGIVAFSISTGATGNNNNTLSNCLIKPTTAGFGATNVGVYSSGTAGKNNSGNTIDNCEFSNILANSAGSSHISIVANSDSWNITNNSFYNTTNFSGVTNSYAIISIAAGNGYNVSGNFIGGKAKNCSGTALTISSSSDIKAIHFGSSVTGTNTINGNTIANIAYTASSTTLDYMVKGIFLQGVANFTVGSSGNGNTIGSMTTTGSITVTNTVSGGFGFAGIRNSSTGTVNVAFNNIGGITIGALGGISNNQSLMISRTAGTVTIDNNTLGGTVANSITQSSNAALYGIFNSDPGGMTVTNNVIQNFNHSGGTSTDCNGIVNNDGTLVATGNNIRNFTLYSNTNNYSIFHQSTGSATINDNVIENINSTGTTSAYFGIAIQAGGTVSCNGNTIGGTTPNNMNIAGNALSYGIYKSDVGNLTCNNNIIQEFNLSNGGSNTDFIGISNDGGSFGGQLSATGNTIKNISCNSTKASSGIKGIYCYTTATGSTIANSTITGLNLTATGASGSFVYGINVIGIGGQVNKNMISGLTNQSSNASASIIGIQVGTTWDIFNNVVLLDNAPYNMDRLIQGIRANPSTGNTVNVYHNTVKISGSIPSGSTATHALYAEGTGTINLVNNIFQDIRTGGTAKHYAEYNLNAGGIYNSNYNFLEVAAGQETNLCNWGGVDYAIAGWKGAPANAAKSLSGSATLDPDGKVTSDPFGGAGTGTNLTATVPDDKLGTTRGIACWMGAYEAQNITVNTISPLAYCASASVSIPYTIGGSGSFNGGNIFTAQLSNSSGDFSSPANIGTLASTSSGTIAATLPGAISGSGFRIRVISSSPQVTGSDNVENINIQTSVPASTTANAASGISCSGFTANWTAAANATNYFLDVATDAGFASLVPGFNNLNVGNITSYTVAGLVAGTTYYYRVRAANGCGSSGNSGSVTASTTGEQRTLVVIGIANGTTTDGTSLRWAITEANSNCGHDIINFGYGAGPTTITLTSALPNLTDADGVTIDGFGNSWCLYSGTVATTNGSTTLNGTGTTFTAISVGTQINVNGQIRTVTSVTSNTILNVGMPFTITASSLNFYNACSPASNGIPNTVPVFNATTSSPLNPAYRVILGNGGTVATGLVIQSGSNNNIIKGFVMQDFGDGTPSANDIAITINGNYNQVLGCYIGIGADGATGGSKTYGGIYITGAKNKIGNGTAAGANLVSGANSRGIEISGATGTINTIVGNMIGLQKDGTSLVSGGQTDGIIIGTSATLNTIGGSSAGDGNVISGQGSSGVYLNSAGNGSNTISGNIIGPCADGVTYVTGNTQGNGFWIFNSNNNTIGGNTAAERNIISANETAGIAMPQASTGNVIKGNYIGIAKNGTSFITGSTQDYGIRIWESSNSNTVGGTGAGEGNVISGNKDGTSTGKGISLESTAANTVVGNIIGPQADGITYLTSNAQFTGINISNCPNNTIGGNTSGARNTISANETYGVYITGASSTGNTIKGNYIGIDKNGTSFIMNSNQDYGVYITSSAASNIIGGSGVGEGNVISANQIPALTGYGIYTNSTAAAGNSILGNIIGPQADGLSNIIGNNDQSNGMYISNSPNNTIGGNTVGARNIISANQVYGIFITGASSTGNVVKGNYIGIDKNGTTFITGSTQNYGVYITASAASNTIGGSGVGEGNVISGNKNSPTSGWGIFIVSSANNNNILGNIIGPQADGVNYLNSNAQTIGVYIETQNNIIGGNTINARNIISANEDQGIYLWGSNATGNVMKGNYIGIDKNGTTFITGSTQNYGVYITASAASNTIGGSGAGEGNVISGNKQTTGASGWGIYTNSNAAAGNNILGNIIGPQADGTSHLTSNGQSTGIEINASPNNTIGGNTSGARNIISANELAGVYITGASSTGNVVKGNYIGIAQNGTSRITGSFQESGVYITSSASSNIVGGSGAGERNVISGNGSYGLVFISQANANTSQGNIIGPQADGVSYVASNTQYKGIAINDAQNNVVGGTAALERNIISGNETYGIWLNGDGVGSTGNIVKGNYIGPGSTLANLTGSNQDYGVYFNNITSGNTIGGNLAGEPNTITLNTVNGIYLINSTTTGNKISGNPIYNNTSKPINLNYGVNQGNNGKASPIIISASTSTITGASEPTNIIEVFKNTTGSCFDATTFVGSTTADGTGNWSLAVTLSPCDYVLATATDGSNNTSEFSTCINIPPTTLATSAITPTSICAGAIFSVPYTVPCPFNPGNIFTAQLSDAVGSFATPTVIGTLTSQNSGTINADLPSSTIPGAGYRIRVVASDPVVTATDNGTNLTISVCSRYWINGAGNWNDSNSWSDVSGGSPPGTGGKSVPHKGVHVYLDNNSFTGPGQIITIPAGIWKMKSINFSGYGQSAVIVGQGTMVTGQ